MEDKSAYRSYAVIHLVWLAAILLLSIIALITWDPSSELLYRYISFAAGISSILLAVIAIFYSMISNNAFNNSLSEIRASASRMAEEAGRLNQASAGISSEAESIIRKLSGLPAAFTDLSGELTGKIDDLASQKTFEDREGSSDQLSSGKFDPGGKPIPLVLSLYVMYLADKTNYFIIPSEAFGGDEYYSSYCSGVLEGMKYFNDRDVQIEAVMDRFSIVDLGKLDLSYLAEKVEGPNKLDQKTLKLINTIREDFGHDPLNWGEQSETPANPEPENSKSTDAGS